VTLNSLLNTSQNRALKALEGTDNLFLTGSAGTGKSFLIQHYLKTLDTTKMPVVASTGAAAILVNGRTFHSFFGIGIMEGGLEETIKRALDNSYITRRLKSVYGVIIDEISMIPGIALEAAETIARKARKSSAPWGGLRVITVGDFSQLPPVTRSNNAKDWAFLNPTWEKSDFMAVHLSEVMRTQDLEFLEILNLVRRGVLNNKVTDYFNSRISRVDNLDELEMTRLFPRKDSVEEYNLFRLDQIKSPLHTFETQYPVSDKRYLDRIKRDAPVPEVLKLKEGALVMMRQNDPEQKWVNGSLGTITEIEKGSLTIALLSTGREVEIEPASFTMLDENGAVKATARNFPINLAYATTIHKSQGMTLDKLCVDLRGAWEHGQAYVALSRIKSGAGLHLEGWTPRSVVMDPAVMKFHQDNGIK